MSMSEQQSLFGGEARSVIYPDAAGYKQQTTSRDAAASIDAGTLRADVVAALSSAGPMTADECAAHLRRSPLSIRPRFSELRCKDAIVDTGARRENASGRRAIVWRLV